MMKFNDPTRHTIRLLSAVPGLIIVSLVLAGCGTPRTPPPVQANNNETAEDAPAAPAEQAPAGGETSQAPTPQETRSSQANASPNATTSQPPVLQSVGAEDARRGSSIRGGGIISEPLRQNFLIQHRIVFEITVKQAEQLYRAEHGRMPRSHEEYMREIIEKNDIELPELEPGWDYYYDATDGELKKRKT